DGTFISEASSGSLHGRSGGLRSNCRFSDRTSSFIAGARSAGIRCVIAAAPVRAGASIVISTDEIFALRGGAGRGALLGEVAMTIDIHGGSWARKKCDQHGGGQ